MALKQFLSQKQDQRLSPQQIQLMKLLQVPTMELEQRIKQEIEENPALEEGKEDAPEEFENQEQEKEDNNEEEFDISDYMDEDHADYKTKAKNQSKDEEERAIPLSGEQTFRERLSKQLYMLGISNHEKLIAETIIGKKGILELGKYSKTFLLLQEIRDESHRFALNAQRKKKRSKITKSKLDSIQGIGNILKQRLLKEFKSISKIKLATIEDLMTVDGINEKIAKLIKNELK